MANAVLQRASVEVRGDTLAWVDTGIVVRAGEYLHIVASGTITSKGKTYYPEGFYYHGLPVDAPRPDLTYAGFWVGGERPAVLPASNVDFAHPENGDVPYSLSVVVLPDGDGPPPLTGNMDAIRPNREDTYNDQQGRVWAIFNAPAASRRYFTGAYFVVVERIGERPPDPGSGEFPYGTPSPIHFVPASILAIKQSPEQCLADLLAIKPVRGPWEGWTSWDKALTAPAYADTLGNVTPSLTYNPNIASRSSQPVALKLDVKSADVTTFAPKMYDPATESPILFMDRTKINAGYYDGAYWEYAQVDPFSNMNDRYLIHCGFIGNIQLDDLLATVELSGYELIANRDVGDEYHIICQVGARIGEEFGAGRCRNEILQDGPLRADWTVEGTVVAGGYDTIRISYSDTAQSGAPLDDDVFKARLANGDVIFWDAPQGGSNAGTRVVLKAGTPAALREVTVALRLSLFSKASVGDKVWLVAGCSRTKTACIAWNNLPNMRAQDLETTRELTQRYRTGS